MLAGFDATVEIAFNAGYTTADADRVWTDVTDYVEAPQAIRITRGRQDEFSQVQPSTCSLTLDNTDGRFTPENVSGAYYPNVKKGRPLRVTITYGGVEYRRFTGYIDEWPVEWDGSTSFAKGAITAVSRTGRMGTAAELRSILKEEVLYDDPVLYYPLSEPEGATAAGNVAETRQDTLQPTQVGAGGTITFGQGVGPTTDDETAPVFARAAAANGLWLRSVIQEPLTEVGDHYLQLEAWFTTSTVDAQTVAVLFADVSNFVLMHIDAAGVLKGTVVSGGAVVTVSGTTVTNGALHRAVLKVSLNDGTGLGMPILLHNSVTYGGGTVAFPKAGGVCFFPQFTQFGVGGPAFATSGGNVGGLFNGTIAQVAVFVQASTELSDSRLAAHGDAGVDGFAGEGAGTRIQRYARLAGIPTAEVSTETGLSTSIAHIDTTGETPIALMRGVETTEDGLLFDGRDGVLTFHARSHRYNATSSFTLDASADEIDTGLAPKLDDQGLANDITVSRPGGASVRATNQDSIDEYGYYREALELQTTSDLEVAAAAEWRANRRGEPRVKIPGVTVEMVAMPALKITGLLAADLGTRFTLSGLPAQAPASSIDFFIEGTTEEITESTYRLSFNTSSAAASNAWRLDSLIYSRLDSSTVLAY